MAALAIFLRRGRRAHALPLSRALCTTTAGTELGVLTVSDARRRLRREHDPDRAVSIMEAIDKVSISAGGTRNALSVAAHRLSRAGRFADAEKLISSYLPACTTEPFLAAVLCSYASANLPEKALDAFRSAAPSLISPLPFNALLSAFSRCRCHSRVPVLFAEISKDFAITPNATSYGILVQAYCMTGDDVKAKQALDQMREQGISPCTKTYTPLIDSMYKQKKTEEAELLWKEMVESGCKPDVAVYNAKAMNYGLHGKPEEVMEVMTEMEADGVKPDIITYNFLMSSYCRNGRLEDAKVVYHSLVEKGCSKNPLTYKYMLAGLCDNGDLDGGLAIFKESLKRNKIPDFFTMKGFVEKLVKGGRVSEANKVIAKMKKRFPGNSLSGWNKLEKELGLDSDSGDTHIAKGASGKIVVKAKFVAADAEAEAFQLDGCAAEETSVSEDGIQLEGCAAEETAVSEESRDEEAAST